MDRPTRLMVTRETTLPDPLKLERFRHAPHLGPRILFFSGGTALRGVSRHLTGYTHNSIHLITPFDSGGSSAVLRNAFHMPAVGDVRNRLMALADQTIQGNPEIFDLFAHRLDPLAPPDALRAELTSLAAGRHRLIRRITDPMRKIIRNHFHIFADHMPSGFDLRGASLGNLVLTAGYLSNRRHLDPVIYLFSKLVEVRGTVRPVTSKNGHLAVRLADGTVITGQHNFTGKATAPVRSPIEDIWITDAQPGIQAAEASTEQGAPGFPAHIRPAIRSKTRQLIHSADLICYPMGSFYSSLIATLLPAGVGQAVARSGKPKIFIPNTGTDPELLGHDLGMQVERLLHHLHASCAAPCKATSPTGEIDEMGEMGEMGTQAQPATADADLLSFVLIDSDNGVYPGTTASLDRQALAARGITVLDRRLVSKASAPYIDETLLNPVLLSLC